MTPWPPPISDAGPDGSPPPPPLSPYVSRLAARWPRGRHHTRYPGTLASVDLSGFTALTERLGVLGRAGAEELTDLVNAVLARLVALAAAEGGDVVSFGGDAILVLFRGPGHPVRACRAVAAMQRWIGANGALGSSRGRVRLRMSAGVHTDVFDVVRVGDRQRALLVVGAPATLVVALEGAARPGQALVSPATAAALDPGWTRRLPAAGAHALRLGRVPPVAESVPRAPGRGGAAWLAPAVARLLRATPGAAELRSAGVAFLLVRGVDGALAADPAAGVGALVAVGRVVEAACVRRGVTWLATDVAADGAKLILAVGVPEAHEADEEHLLRCLREIADAASGHGLAVGIGAAAGPVYAGDVGHPSRRTFTVMGDAVNLAARLAAAAEPGAVLVTPGLPAAAERAFRLEEVAPFGVKGKREPVRALRLGRPAGRRRGRPAGALVGRERERAVLVAALAAAGGGRGGCIEVVAAPGMGKSHLVADALGAARGLRVGRGEGDPYATTIPYAAVAPAVRGLLGIPPDADPASAARALARRVEALAPDLGPWLPLAAAAAGVAVAETPATRRLDPAFRAPRLHEVTIELLGRAGGGLALVVDDLQWADDASRALLVALARQGDAAGHLVIATRRPEGRSLGDEVEGVRLVELGPLPAAEARRLVVAAADGGGLADDALESILARARGHPFVLRQLVQALEAGLADLPPDLERMTAARIDRLDPRDRRLLRQAAVAGRQVDLDLLAAAVGDERVADAPRWRGLGEFVEVADGGARFRHDLYRESAYAGLPRARRTEIHRALGDALLARTGRANRAAVAPLLATHFAGGGRPGEAWRFATLAARSLARESAWAEAAAMDRIALAAADRLPGVPPERTAAVSVALARALEHLARVPEALDALPSGASGDARLDAEAQILRARLNQRLGRFAAALAATARARRALPDADAGSVGAEALLRRASIRHQQGRYAEALRLASQADRAARGAGLRGRAKLQLAMTRSSLGDPEAEATARSAAALLRRARNDVALGNLLTNMGADRWFLGRWQEVPRLWEASARAFGRAGDSSGVATVANNLAELYAQQGRLAEARDRLAEARRVFIAGGDEYSVALTESLLGTIAVQDGDVAEGERRLAGARATFARLGAEEFVLDADLRLAEAHLWRDRAEEARRAATDCLRRAPGLGSAGMNERWARRLLAWAACRLGRLDEALRLGEELVEAARAVEAPAELALCLLTLEAITERMGRPVDATLVAERNELVATLDFAALPRLPL